MVKWTPKSETDLDEILDHIAKNFDVNLAIKTIHEIIDFVETTLSNNPLAGAVVKNNPLFFKLIFLGNTIYYCDNAKDKNLYIVYVQPCKTVLKLDRLNNDEVA